MSTCPWLHDVCACNDSSPWPPGIHRWRMTHEWGNPLLNGVIFLGRVLDRPRSNQEPYVVIRTAETVYYNDGAIAFDPDYELSLLPDEIELVTS